MWFEQDLKLGLADFQNGFSDFLVFKNLEKLEGEDCSKAHSDRCQYKDKLSKIYYYNHFNKTSDDEKEYIRVKNLFDKRCARLNEFLKNSKRVLFLLVLKFDADVQLLQCMHNVLAQKYPQCEIHFRILEFNCVADENIEIGNIKISKYKREQNLYDYTKTNYCWQFLDELRLSKIFQENNAKFNNCFKSAIAKFVDCKKIKKGLAINIFSFCPTALYFKLYFLGFRFQFTLGKPKKE